MAGLKEKIIGGFRILQELQAGSGSQGTVYKAVCEDGKHGVAPVGAVVALKVMAVQDEGGSQWRKLQKRTAELATLDHPNVVKYYGCFSEQGMFNDVHVVVQEFLQGVTLKERLARQKTGMDVDEGLRVVDLTLAGLEYMAGRGIVHRDLKPGNIFLCDDGSVKLIDFEIAKQEGGTVTASVGNIRGSFDYMAPDFTNPEFHGDVQSDVFSMGVVLHEVLTGKTPYERLEGDDKQANFAFLSRWAQTVSGGHNPIRISSRVKRLLANADVVLASALAPKREDRYADFTAFRSGIKSIHFRSLKNGDTSYHLLQFIGKGGFGEVFKARDRKTGQLVAVKHLMKTAYAERFHREAKIMRKLTSPCFVQFVDFFVMESGGGQEAFLVMAFLDGMPGSSLRDAIRRREEAPMEWRDVFVAFVRYARGLLAMHQQGIYHRDIKPSNLYYPDGHPENAAIMDLGIARDVNGTATTGQVPGTLDYMPPEVVLSDSRGDGRMDIYALGLCLYESLSGKMAFPRLPSGTTAYAAFFNRARENSKPAFDAPEVRRDAEVLSLLEDMTNPDATRRLKNAGLLLKRLESIVESRFGEGSCSFDEPETVAPTVAMTSEDASTVATSVMDGAGSAIELERQRMASAAKSRLWILSAAAGVLILAAAGVAAYLLREPIRDGLLPKDEAGAAEARALAEAADAAKKAKAAHDAAEEEKSRRDAQAKREAEEAAAKEAEKARKAEEAAKRKAEEAARQKAAAEAARIAAERKVAEEKAAKEMAAAIGAAEAARKEAERKAAAEAAARKEAELKAAEAVRKEAERKAAEEARKEAERKAAEAARKEAEREAEAKRLEAERKAAEAARKEAERKAEEERRRLEDERKAAEEAARKEAERKAAEEAARKEAERRAAEEAARKEAERKAKEERRRLEDERKAAEAAAKAAEEARKKAEAEMAAKMAEMERQLKAAQEKAEKEKAEREAEAKRLEAERKAAEAARKEAERKAEEERRRLEDERKAAQEKAQKEKAEREAEAKRLEDERRKAEEAQRKAEEARLKAEEARKKAEEDSKRIAAERKRREDTVNDLVEKAGLYYESEDYYEAVKNYHEAHKNGFTVSGDNLENFKDAYRKASEKLKTLKARCENQISLGQTPLRAIKDIDQEIKNLVDWNFDVTSQ